MRDTLLKLCVSSLREKGLDTDQYQERLVEEVKELDAQADHEYFVELHLNGMKFDENESNLLIAFLLDLVDDFDINLPALRIQGEFPDIDIDYLPQVREYLKVEWAPKKFGRENVCAIGNYTTYGIKSSLIDMAKVHDKDRNEILRLTTQIGLKDDEGKAFTWDKALEKFPDLAKYCEDNPDVADAAHRLLHRNRGMGMHAGGLIISNQRLDKLVPLVKGKDNAYVSAFVEGLSGTDLGPLGLIKFDLLVVTDLKRIVECSKLAKESASVAKESASVADETIDKADQRVKDIANTINGPICALPGSDDDWSDTSYLNDPKSLAMANEGRLKCIFQFDSDGMRDLVRDGGVTRFDDLAAYSALYRPGPLNMEMDKAYVRRKKGYENVDIHPVLKPILLSTYGVMVFQEQVMKILNVVGDIPLIHCEKVRKAMSKKQVAEFARYKEQFIERGQQNLGWNIEDVSNLWDQVEAFAEYGFNKSHAVAYAYISSRLLYLKSHFPIEFYCGTMQCETQSKKIKDYKLEAEKQGVALCRVNTNLSGWNWKIVDGEIYMGFSDIKGIGEEVSQRIEAGQPYSSFDDFLNRFGHEAKVLKPLIALKCFGEEEREVLHEFWEYYRKEKKKREDRDKRAVRSREKIVEEMAYLMKDDRSDVNPEGFLVTLTNDLWKDKQKDFELQLAGCAGEEQVSGLDTEQVYKVAKKYKKNFDTIIKKQSGDVPITLADFTPTGEIDEECKEIYNEMLGVAEKVYYGFSWQHPMEFSPDYVGEMSFDKFDEDETLVWAMVECQIVKQPKTRISKKGNEYFVFDVEDENFIVKTITMWREDYMRFKQEIEHWEGDFRQGNLLKLRLERPGPGFKSYTFQSPKKQDRGGLPADKALDPRLMVMARPERVPLLHTPSKAEEKLLEKINEEGFTIVGL
jgi:DNA polymerase III alpha subunit